MCNHDGVHAFQLKRIPIRGRIGRLSQTLQQLLTLRKYPACLNPLIAEAAIVTVLIGELIPPGWKLSIQVRTRGPLRLIASDFQASTEPGGVAKIRTMATYDESLVRATRQLPALNCHDGYFAVLMDRNDGKKPVHGLVPLESPTLSQCAEDYFCRSEQILTRFAVVVGESVEGSTKIWRGGGMVIQHLPDENNPFGLNESESWSRAGTLLSSVDPLELTGPSVSMWQTVYRLFHEEQPQAEPLRSVEFGCSCSAEKVRQSLSIYSAQDIATMTTARGTVTADCQFCGHRYEFDPATLGFESQINGSTRA